jgi:endonuclease/exonuclease/phosphatase family metal-dependent hydrolase
MAWLAVAGLMLLAGCGGSDKIATPTPDNPFDTMKVGTDSTLEVMTWNIENFAKAGATTAGHVADAIAGLDVDVVAMQEIVSQDMFDRVVASLDGWDGYRASSDGFGQNLAYIYRTDGPLEVTSIYEILTNQWSPLPRSPLVLEGTIGGLPYAIINNHYKCCGDGELDPGDSGDEETRRFIASQLIQEYVEAHLGGHRVLVVGDFNDELDDPAADNVFQNFLNQPDFWRFVDMPIAVDDNTLWSYPSWPSHIDHILINGHTFADFETPAGLVQVVPLHQMLPGGWSDYDDEISDHLPVCVRLEPRPDPNPFMPARIGTGGTLEVVTWNLENFGSGAEETELAALAIAALDADVVMLQEVVSAAQFTALVDALEDYDGYLGTGAPGDINLAVLYKNDGSLEEMTVTAPLPADPLNLLRPPLLLQARWQGQPFAVLNVHHKCCGDGVLDTEDPYDDENRRYQANLLIKTYLEENLSDVPVVVAGDFNDLLDDPLGDNVFLDFLVAPEEWEFADLDIAMGEADGWSMPGIPAHVDHILVTSEFFEAILTGDDFLIEVSPLADLLPGGWTQYRSQLSDHLPLAIRLQP